MDSSNFDSLRKKIGMGTIHLRRLHVLGGEGCPHCRRLPMLGGEGSQECRRQQFLTLSGDKFQFQVQQSF